MPSFSFLFYFFIFNLNYLYSSKESQDFDHLNSIFKLTQRIGTTWVRSVNELNYDKKRCLLKDAQTYHELYLHLKNYDPSSLSVCNHRNFINLCDKLNYIKLFFFLFLKK